MRLAVISDSHLSIPDDRFERVYDRYLSGADALLHCGDMVSAALYHSLCRHPRLLAVRGNCDHFLLDHDLPQTLSAELPLASGRKLRIGMAHGWGERSTVWQRVADTFPAHDLICFGHTHRRAWTEHQGAHLLNPGSLAEGSMAYIDVADDGALTCTFVDVAPDD
ncbi:MAG: metallophosphoesterase family protein [Humidesulfovibrio sp.]|uniref:metallophosphoesterase family protein n=1 Tax=Humidesulfovibrio sp. TaxID=2910988 RepID=UPI0027F096A2|nr:metallophosphoesterase family protein [Humidesulfovibrio sp.]MDQ7834950.1 metallophosphoesterase family protein [Humidesulfovibrio sp.]